jgi:hypothetical protein
MRAILHCLDVGFGDDRRDAAAAVRAEHHAHEVRRSLPERHLETTAVLVGQADHSEFGLLHGDMKRKPSQRFDRRGGKHR